MRKPKDRPPRFPVGRCKKCLKKLKGELAKEANGQTIVYCSYECYCMD